jgi:fibronectin-binding autotransporter adhesin
MNKFAQVLDLGNDSVRAVPLGDSSDAVTIPDAHFLFHAEFKRTGSDLTLIGQDGQKLVIPGYFKHEKLPTLFAPDGSALTGDIVEVLAGSVAPHQYAQAGAPAASAPLPIGRVASVQGNATAVRNGAAVTLNVGDAVYQNDVIQTGNGNSTVGVIFGDGSTFNLTANARMVLNEFVYNPAPGSVNSALINLVAGSITFIAGEVARSGDMKVGTPTAVLGIRGTWVQVDIEVNIPIPGIGPPGLPPLPGSPLPLDAVTVKMSVLVEPSGRVGAFNIFSLSGQLIGTVNNANNVTTVTAAGPAQAVAQVAQKTQAELTQAFNVVQQAFQTQQLGQAVLAAQPVPRR